MELSSCLLALNRIFHLTPVRIQQILAHFADLSELFSLKESALHALGFNAQMAKRIRSFDFGLLEADYRFLEAPNHHFIFYTDKNYPILLKEIHHPPIVLYAKGSLDVLLKPSVAMVGTRKPSIQGEKTAQVFARDLAAKGLVIVSGLALGIDAAAHRGALESSGDTIAVMGTGMNHRYPKQHLDLADKISNQGLLLTEFPLECAPRPGHFPQRNRIISGLSLATLVVEAAIKSGSLITARFALEQNREVLAVPGSIYNLQAQGCHLLLQQGAKLVTCCREVIEELPQDLFKDRLQYDNLDSTLLAVDLNKVFACKMRLSQSNQDLLDCIEPQMTAVDLIVSRSGLMIHQVLSGLAELELQGFIQAVPGGYMRCIL